MVSLLVTVAPVPPTKEISGDVLITEDQESLFDKKQHSILSSRTNLSEWPLKSAYPIPINLGSSMPQGWRYLESSNLASAPFSFPHKHKY